MRIILHVDMDAFFAAIELLRHPELQGKPVIVGGRGDPMERGVVSTASYEAREYGIYSGMPLRTAFHHCPEAIFLPVDYEYYVQVSAKIKTILNAYSPHIEDVGLDEAFLDLSDSKSDPIKIAKEIKQRIKKETGLSCSVGIGPNKLLAKIASDLEKPDGLTYITKDDITSRIWPLSVRKIWGVGPKTEAKLAAIGVTTIGELAALAEAKLTATLGAAHGHYLHEAAQGIDTSPVVSHHERMSIGHEITFQHDTSNQQLLQTVIDDLAYHAVVRLQNNHLLAQTVTLKLRYADFETHTHAITLAVPSDDTRVITQAAIDCLGNFSLTRPVRLVGIRLSKLKNQK